MYTTLIVEKSAQLQSFFAINLHTWVGSSSSSYNTATLAIDYLKTQGKNINLIITRDKIGTEKTADALRDFITKQNLEIPMVVIGKSENNSDKVIDIDSGLDIKTLVMTSAQALGVTAQDMAKVVVPEFFEIPLQFFHHLSSPICPVYLQNVHNEKYELRFDAYQEYHNGVIKDLASEGYMGLFVKKDDRLKFVTNLNQELASIMPITDLNSDEQMTAMEMSQALVQEKIAKLGITPETIQLSKTTLKNMIVTGKKTPSLKRLLARMLKNKSGYLFKHTQILIVVSQHLMTKMDWGNKEQSEKLQFIAFFHDLALETSEQAMISTEEGLKKSDMPDVKKDLVKKHAQISASLVAQFPRAPMGAEQIIKQHHGMTNGIGFADNFGANLSPLAIVFVVAEDFTHEILTKNNDFDVKTKLAQMRKRYSTQRFQKIINALESIVM
jgi:HD-GYP domain-containing protein (c-di-GMP phosphodiesterase class II)